MSEAWLAHPLASKNATSACAQQLMTQSFPSHSLGTLEIRWLLDQLHDAVFTTDAHGTITDWNRGAMMLNGWTPEEAIGRPLSLLYPGDEDAGLLDTLMECAAREGSCVAQLYCTPKNGKPYPCRLSIRSLRDGAGALVGALGVVSDASDYSDVTLQLKAAIRDRDALIQEVHHRVFNNFQVVSSLLALHARELNCEKCEEAMRRACLRVETMARVHGGLYQSEGTERVPAQQLLRDVLRALTNASTLEPSHLRLEVEPPDATLGLKQAAALAMLVAELGMYLLGRQAGTVATPHLLFHFEVGASGSVLRAEAEPLAPASIAAEGPSDTMNTFMIPVLCDQLGGVLTWNEDHTRAHLSF